MWELPPRMSVHSAWLQHTAMVPVIVALTRPRVFVELGSHAGDSYCAFCESVLRMEVGTQCAAVDTWTGDVHAGQYSPAVLQSLREFHDRRYAGFSRLMQMTFDAALTAFPEGSIDLLHIDGLHTYEAVKHDFESWRPKLSEHGVVLLHDTAARLEGFGVWKFWEEVAGMGPSFNVPYGWGLGMLAAGKEVSREFVAFLEALREDPRILGVLGAIGQRNEIFRTLNFAAEALCQCHDMANQWRTQTGRPVANKTLELQQAMNLPQAGAVVANEVLAMANGAVGDHLELKKLRQGKP